MVSTTAAHFKEPTSLNATAHSVALPRVSPTKPHALSETSQAPTRDNAAVAKDRGMKRPRSLFVLELLRSNNGHGTDQLQTRAI